MRVGPKGVSESSGQPTTDGPRVSVNPPSRPHVFSEAPELGEEKDIGETTPMIKERRELRAVGRAGRGGELDRAMKKERRLAAKVSMITEHGLTPPPEMTSPSGNARPRDLR